MVYFSNDFLYDFLKFSNTYHTNNMVIVTEMEDFDPWSLSEVDRVARGFVQDQELPRDTAMGVFLEREKETSLDREDEEFLDDEDFWDDDREGEDFWDDDREGEEERVDNSPFFDKLADYEIYNIEEFGFDMGYPFFKNRNLAFFAINEAWLADCNTSAKDIFNSIQNEFPGEYTCTLINSNESICIVEKNLGIFTEEDFNKITEEIDRQIGERQKELDRPGIFYDVMDFSQEISCTQNMTCRSSTADYLSLGDIKEASKYFVENTIHENNNPSSLAIFYEDIRSEPKEKYDYFKDEFVECDGEYVDVKGENTCAVFSLNEKWLESNNISPKDIFSVVQQNFPNEYTCSFVDNDPRICIFRKENGDLDIEDFKKINLEIETQIIEKEQTKDLKIMDKVF